MTPAGPARSPYRQRSNEFGNGPDWPPTTEVIMAGLYRRAASGPGNHLKATQLLAVRRAAVRLGHSVLRNAVIDDALPEYRNSLTGEPEGARQFSWTAALTIKALDLLERFEDLR